MSLDAFQSAWKSYEALGRLLRDLSVNEAVDKSVSPLQIVKFLGILYDFIHMLLLLLEDKMCELKAELKRWKGKKVMRKKQLERLVGKLQFAAACVLMQEEVLYLMTDEVRQDVKWWSKFIARYNGTSIMWLQQKQTMLEFFATDACLEGAGGYCQESYFHIAFPDFLFQRQEKVFIAHLELWAIIVGIKIWKEKIKGVKFAIACDNQVVVNVINTGRSKNKLLQQLLREMTYNLAVIDVETVAKFIEGYRNEVPDLLSRWTLGNKSRKQFELIKKDTWRECDVDENVFNLSEIW